MDICRKCSTDMEVDAGGARDKVSFQVCWRICVKVMSVVAGAEEESAMLCLQTSRGYSYATTRAPKMDTALHGDD